MKPDFFVFRELCDFQAPMLLIGSESGVMVALFPACTGRCQSLYLHSQLALTHQFCFLQ